MVNVPAVAPLLVTTPAAVPVTLATCCEKLFVSNVPVTLNAVPIGNALLIPLAIVPALIVVAPV